MRRCRLLIRRLEVFIGYGADHNTKVGVSGCIIPYGKGQIVLYCLPQLARSLRSGNFAISPVIAQRFLGDALGSAPTVPEESKALEEN